MDPYRDVAAALGTKVGRSGRSLPFDLIAQIETGLPVSSLDRLSEAIAPDDVSFKFRIVPRATYARRKKKRRLSAAESADVARLARVWSFAKEVWRSDGEARDFLFRRNLLLEDRRPIDVAISSDIGARLVEDLLGKLAYGSAV